MHSENSGASDAQIPSSNVIPLSDADAARLQRLAQAQALIDAVIPPRSVCPPATTKVRAVAFERRAMTVVQTGVTVEERPWSAVSCTADGEQVIRGKVVISTAHYRVR
ncbi:hypothetical protein PQR34_44035 [Paraburkholderia sediminicola]|uniref:hypothetical protein n=1 Tax=Paraburkholderia sediminicola TaxID=458836 RepID=UPI0038B950A7